MRVLLINPPIFSEIQLKVLPIGLGIIANVLVDEGHEVKILDINAEGLSKSQVKEKIDLSSRYEVIGTGGLITTYKYLKWLIPQLRGSNPNSKIVVGGGVVTENATLLLSRTPADIAVIGEGETTMKELISTLESDKSLARVKGIAYKKDDQTIKVNQPRPLIKDLDVLPFPAYKLFPMDVYLHNVAHSYVLGKKTEMGIITARGCPYNCHYCYRLFGGGVRIRSIDNVIAEIRHLIGKYKVESIRLSDETFTISKKRVLEFCSKMVLEKVDVPWSCYGRVNLVDRDMLKKMKQSGCYRVGYGIESGSQRILDNMNKRVTVEQAKKAVKLTRSVGLISGTTFMFGYPNETLETIRETISFCQELLLAPSFFFTTPYPSTKLYEQTKDRIIKKYGDEEKFIEALGDAAEFTVNLTDFLDEQLFKLKAETERLLRKKRLRSYVKVMYIRYKQFGLYLLAKRFVSTIVGKISKRKCYASQK